MAKQGPTKAKTATGGKKGPVEWACELAKLPASIDNGVERYQPEGVLWAAADGRVLGFHVAPPGRALADLGESFRNTARKPMFGRPHVPARVRAASEELALALRSALGDEVEVVVAPTPETATVLAELASSFGGAAAGEEEPATHFVPGITPAAVAALYRAAARFYRAAPWTSLTDTKATVRVSCEAVGLVDGAVMVLGQSGEKFGFLLFSDAAGLEAFLRAVTAFDAGMDADIPQHLGLVFEPRGELRPGLLDEIKEHGFEVAGPAAYPGVLVFLPTADFRGPDREELRLAEIVTTALAAYAEAPPAPGRRVGSRTVEVETANGQVDVTLSHFPSRPPVGRSAPGRRRTPRRG